jgi:hypothetical protein
MSETTETPRAPLAFVDTETDGVHPNRRPWEIAVIRREPDGRETEWTAFVEIDLSSADPFGLRVGKFYDRHPLGRRIAGDDDLPQPYRENILALHHATMTVAQMTHDAVLVGINTGFDAAVLDALLRAHGLLPGWDYTPVCAKVRAAGWLAGRGLIDPAPPWKTADVVEKLGILDATEDERHTALGDARLALRMFDAVTGPDPQVDLEHELREATKALSHVEHCEDADPVLERYVAALNARNAVRVTGGAR